MSQRLSNRTPVHIDVEVQFPGHEPMIVKTRDISLNGMFLETGRAIVPPQTIIGVGVRADNAHPEKDLQLIAIVTRQTRQGLGVNYPLCSETAREQLRGLIEAVRQQAKVSQKPGSDEPARCRLRTGLSMLPEEG